MQQGTLDQHQPQQSGAALPPQGGQQQQNTQQRDQGKSLSQKKRATAVIKASTPAASNLNSYIPTICLGCGEPGHAQISCTKPAACAICKMVTHAADDCPVRKRPHKVAKYVGSAASGLGYFKIDIPDVNGQHLGNLRNIGLALIEPGEITKEELAKEFALIYKTNWPWQIRKLTNWSFLVKFPPEIPVETVASYPCFGLCSREDISVRVVVWDGEIQHVSVVEEVWIQLRGLNPKWCEWDILDQITSVFGTLQDIDWKSTMQDISESVRVKISCKDHTKIPPARIFEFGKKFYQIHVTVEMPAITSNTDSVNNDKNSEEIPGSLDSSMDADRDSRHTSGSTGGCLAGARKQLLQFQQNLQLIPKL